ncbi:MAG: hypothetical protein ACREMV_11335, partial [Gemmatimonadales bacterium]
MLRGVRPQIAQELLLEIVLQNRPELSGTPVAKAKVGRCDAGFRGEIEAPDGAKIGGRREARV